ncbi:MAG: STAS domain-containing protein [Mycobacterium sp.]
MSEQPKLDNESTGSVTCVIGEEWVGRVAVLSVSGVVDMLTAPQLEEAIGAAVGKTPAALIVDLTDVEFLASAGMGVLVGAHDQLPAEVKFAVVADGPVTSRPLKLVGIADIVDLFQTRDEALAKIDA